VYTAAFNGTTISTSTLILMPIILMGAYHCTLKCFVHLWLIELPDYLVLSRLPDGTFTPIPTGISVLRFIYIYIFEYILA
jgi:hypothetical protein